MGGVYCAGFFSCLVVLSKKNQTQETSNLYSHDPEHICYVKKLETFFLQDCPDL